MNASMSRRKVKHKKKTNMYWWNSELKRLKGLSVAARRKYTKLKGNEELKEKWHTERVRYKRAIVMSKRRCWDKLFKEVENEPWGLTYKIINKKLASRRKIPGLNDPTWVKEIINGLFPKDKESIRQTTTMITKFWKINYSHERN